MSADDQACDELLRQTAEKFGLPFSPGAIGLEFEVGQVVASALRHPSRPEQLIVQVAVVTLDDNADPRLFRVMLELNEMARFTHEWMITVDVDGEVSISRSLSIATATALELEDMLGEAISRAEDLLDALQQAPSRSGEQSAQPMPGSGLRG